MSPRTSLPRAVLACSLVGLSAASASAQSRTPTHVACVGDSITAGYLASSSSKSYPSVLQTLFGGSVQVMNFGHSGATLLTAGDTPYTSQSEYQASNTFVSNAGASAVVDVILMLGTNDTKSYNWADPGGGTRAQQFKTDCAALADHYTGLATHPLVFLALPPKIFTNSFGIDDAVLHDQIIPVIEQVAMEKGLPTIDLYTPTAGHPEYFSDGVHPTDSGYAIVAGLMHDGLLQALAGAGGSGGAAGGGAAGKGAGGAGAAAGGASGGGLGGGGATGGTAGRGTAGGGVAGSTQAGGAGAGGSGTGGVLIGGGGAGVGGGVAGTGVAAVAGNGGRAAIGAGGSGGAATGGAATGGTGAGGAGAATVGGSGAGSAKPPTNGDAGGCGCSMGTTRASRAVPFGLFLLLLAWRRSRRKQPR